MDSKSSFQRLIKSIYEIGNDGKSFEHFSKWFLLNHPFWKNQVDKVWLWKDWPNRWGPDNGIDLVMLDKLGRNWAVQSKCYNPEYQITKASINSFIAESENPLIHKRLLLATTNKINSVANRLMDSKKNIPVTRFLLSDFENSKMIYPDNIKGINKYKIPNKLFENRKYQSEAVSDVKEKFKKFDRGQLIMACGTGKTLVTLLIKEQLNAKSTLVLVPSLNLLSQTLFEWTGNAQKPFLSLSVCSDTSVGNKSISEDLKLGEQPFEVTSNIEEIKKFLKKKVRKVLFSTYQSSELIALAQQDKSISDFDLVVADEAHRCVGRADSNFTRILNDKEIRAKKRLFCTATPRFFSSSVKKEAHESNNEIAGMDDIHKFGPRFHTLSFSSAISKNILSDFQIIIVGVDEKMIKTSIDNRELLSLKNDITITSDYLASAIGLIKSVKEYNLNRIISFHSRVRGAKNFQIQIPLIMDLMDKRYKPVDNLWIEHVAGNMATSIRKGKIDKLREVDKGEIGILTNARCLGEGVDIPTLDGVCYVDPKRSKIDIIQSVGRAIRKSENKKKGTIILPVFIEANKNAEELLESSSFKNVWEVIKALRSHDDRLAETFDALRRKLGKKNFRLPKRISEKIIFDLPKSVNTKFFSSIQTRLVETASDSWHLYFALLESYKDEFGDCLVPVNYVRENFKLGIWVVNQRKKRTRNELMKERISLLNSLGFIWNVPEYEWRLGIKYLSEYKNEYGDCLVPYRFKFGNYPLGSFVHNKRAERTILTKEQKSELDALGFVWDVLEYRWNAYYKLLEAYKKKFGNCLVPDDYLVGNKNLGTWVSKNRSKKEKLTNSQIDRLEALGFIWNIRVFLIEQGILYMKAHKILFGHVNIHNQFIADREKFKALVDEKYLSHGDYKLGGWVTTLRTRAKRIETAYKKEIENLGFVWKPMDVIWEQNISFLKDFVQEFGHARVPQSYMIGDVNLGRWVSKQRTRAKSMSAERKKRLNDLGFIWDASELRTSRIRLK